MTVRRIAVAAGCLVDAQDRVLVAQRPAHKPHPGQWEFPGGKIEPGEAVATALARELREELGVELHTARPLIRLSHRYPEFEVDLSVWRVDGWRGESLACEGQRLAWVPLAELSAWPLLAADAPIVTALRLPEHYVFTPSTTPLAQLRPRMAALPPGALLRLRRAPGADTAIALAGGVRAAQAAGISQVLVDRRHPTVPGAAGIHLRADELADASPRRARGWLGVSVHDREELARAEAVGADFAVLGNVHATATHPERPGLGWARWAQIREGFRLPVYAIGGVGPQDLHTAWAFGAQGVAGISAYW